MVPLQILTISLAVQFYLCESSIEANSQRPCWMCDVPHCKQCVASEWTPWNQCSSPCGMNGYQSRTRLVYRPPSCGEKSCRNLTAKEWRPCNRFCYNGGTPARWACTCPPLNYIGDCCETGLCNEKWNPKDSASNVLCFKFRITLVISPISSLYPRKLSSGSNIFPCRCPGLSWVALGEVSRRKHTIESNLLISFMSMSFKVTIHKAKWFVS